MCGGGGVETSVMAQVDKRVPSGIGGKIGCGTAGEADREEGRVHMW